jgi:hypothetical protein
MQPFAVFDAMAYAESNFGANAARKILAETSKTWLIPGYAKQYVDSDITHALTLRKAGEVAVEETLAKVGRAGGARAKFIRGGLSLMQKADVRTAAGAMAGFERILKDAGVANAKHEAAVLMDLTQSASDVSFRPHVLAWGEGARTWFTFQTFMLNRWGIVAHDIVTKGLIKGEGRGRFAALVGMGILIASKIAEDEAREYIYELVNRRKLPDRSVLQDVLYALPSNIPAIGNLFEMVSSRGGSDIPVMKLLNDFFRIGLIPGMTYKRTGKPNREAQAKAALRGVEAGAILLGGVPGTAQAFDLIQAALFPEEKKKGAIRPRAMMPPKDN